MRHQKNIAVILAGGRGTRLGAAVPKQFLEVGGKKIIEYSIDAFENNPNIDEIAIVSNKECISEVENIVRDRKYQKVSHILCGGKERCDSTLAAIDAFTNDNDNLLFHDAVRPLVTQRIINDCIHALASYRAVTTAINTTDTIIELDSEGLVAQIPNRAKLRNVQTPQGFKRGIIKKAYDLAQKDSLFSATDDCGVLHKYLPDEPIYIIKGETLNIKITYPEDLFLLEKRIQAQNNHLIT